MYLRMEILYYIFFSSFKIIAWHARLFSIVSFDWCQVQSLLSLLMFWCFGAVFRRYWVTVACLDSSVRVLFWKEAHFGLTDGPKDKLASCENYFFILFPCSQIVRRPPTTLQMLFCLCYIFQHCPLLAFGIHFFSSLKH